MFTPSEITEILSPVQLYTLNRLSARQKEPVSGQLQNGPPVGNSAINKVGRVPVDKWSRAKSFFAGNAFAGTD